MKRTRTTTGARRLELVLCGLFALAGSPTHAAVETAAPAAAAESPSQILFLEFQETTDPILYVWAGGLSGPARVRLPPGLSQEGLYRGRLLLAAATSGPVACVWDQPAGKLYVDLNRNEDLTDATDGVFTAVPGAESQTFTNAVLQLDTPAGLQPVLVDLLLYRVGNQEHPVCRVALRSFWQGKLQWQGRECQVGIVPGQGRPGLLHGKGYLLLRPWEMRTNRIDLVNGTPDALEFVSKVFWLGQAFELDYAFVTNQGAPRCRLEIREQPAELGELKVSGQFLHRIILENSDAYTAVLDAPGPGWKVPVGTYNVSELWVQRDKDQAVHTSRDRITIAAAKPASLAAGGPLTNMLSVERRGRDLVLNYLLLGAGGHAFRMVPQDREHPPTFVISRGGEQVASGDFEYG